ncbi:MAG TPA: efflux RND transporter permease subunit, partial [Burkholderiales bacterium]|nr:efflux RND transporter permease subunit [Burkholderiales bacterium]
MGQRGGALVRIGDVARVLDGPEERVRASVLLTKEGAGQPEEAVSIAFSKRKGTNVVVLAKQLQERARIFAKDLPADIAMTEVRNYGATAEAKTIELIEHLLLATLSVSVLIAVAMGVRASLLVALAIPVTLALTLAIYYFTGYTLNRVTLFALIFSIGILVDDAIVVVENIERHLKMNRKAGLVAATIAAVAEVGNPTILATFTVIAAILPMAFVSGLMGPYMKPIPVGASLAMLLSLFVAFIVTPWAAVRVFKKHSRERAGSPIREQGVGKLDRLYRSVMELLLRRGRASLWFGALAFALLLGASSLVYFKAVRVKLLPFDNKSEFQVLLDFPAQTPLARNLELSTELGRELLRHPEVLKVQVFAGEAAPFSFSGMVKHTYLRGADYAADLQIVLNDKDKRAASSHTIIESLRPVVQRFGARHGAVTKVLEIPPGPPVLSTMLAEVYGPDENTRQRVAREVYAVFAAEPSVVDLDATWRLGRARKLYTYDQLKGGMRGADAQQVLVVGSLIFSETPLLSLNDVSSPEDVNVELSVEQAVRARAEPFAYQSILSSETGTVNIAATLNDPRIVPNETLYRKNLKPVSYVMSELAGAEEAPVYGMLKLAPKIGYAQQTAEVPWHTQAPVVKW